MSERTWGSGTSKERTNSRIGTGISRTRSRDAVTAAIDLLEELGPGLGRPHVGIVKGAKAHNLKELIPRGSNIRVLFVFDPRRTAILLLGGDKAGRWAEWYDEMIPVADGLYEKYIEQLRREDVLPS
jgi:hypothetical protein